MLGGGNLYILQSRSLRRGGEEVLQMSFSKCKTVCWGWEVSLDTPSHFFGYTVEYSLPPMVSTTMEGQCCLEGREKEGVSIRILFS